MPRRHSNKVGPPTTLWVARSHSSRDRSRRLLIGTGNPAKLRRYQTIVGELIPELRLTSLRELAGPLPTVVEDGATARDSLLATPSPQQAIARPDAERRAPAP